MAAREYSISPGGEKFPIPDDEDRKEEFERLKKIVGDQRRMGREIVVVVGVGFVGAVMAAVVADSTDENDQPDKFVIGI